LAPDGATLEVERLVRPAVLPAGRPFCRQEGLSEPTFYTWRKKLTERKPHRSGATRTGRASTFIEGSLPDAGPAPLERVFQGGPILRIAPGTDAADPRAA